MGSSDDEPFNQMIEYESQKHGDILQGNFLDQFKQTNFKSIAALTWLTTNCQNVKYYIKLKHDIEINPMKLDQYLKDSLTINPLKNNLLFCDFKFRPKVDRDKESKFYVKFKEHQRYFYDYKYVCSENGYVLSNRLARNIFKYSFYSELFWIDDVYIAKIYDNLQDLIATKIEFLTISYESFELLNENSTLFYKHNVKLTTDFVYAWNLIKKTLGIL
ncbi:unnamed protein product [Brachionus calyciflorus]|uniref:Hexosyltransferase n=1 Tax=Brachionus calyciflorus TaxID=104777 RepID=A0A813XYF9_9BILA|nr:unnamed protein product [Brachionus calyciflorus]